MMTSYKKFNNIFLTNALPYANGPLHVGHLVGYLQADIWKRFRVLEGSKCIHICGADCHGVPIMLSAEKHNVNPEQLTESIYKQHIRDLAKFDIHFTSYLTTKRTSHHIFVQQYYNQLKDKGFIYKKVVKRPFDKVKKMFVADRMVLGECPYCHAQDQYGDACDKCSKHYSPAEMKNPISAITKSALEFRDTEDVFFNFQKLRHKLFSNLSYLKPSEKTMIANWNKHDLNDWSISRDDPYYGIPIPGEKNKFFYVWFDAFLSYLSIPEDVCSDEQIWDKSSQHYIAMYLGKDIAHLHAIHFASMLIAGNKKLPNMINVNGFINIGVNKMSKSKQFLSIDEYLEIANPNHMRLFVAENSHGNSEDLRFDAKDTVRRFDKLIVSKILNIASRVDPLMKKFNYCLSTNYSHLDEQFYKAKITNVANSSKVFYEEQKLSKVIGCAEDLANCANRLINEYQPWSKECNPTLALEVCSIATILMSAAIGNMKPILPDLSSWLESHLDIDCSWGLRGDMFSCTSVSSFKRFKNE